MTTTKTEIRISAKDETARAFRSAKARMSDMNKSVNRLAGSMKVFGVGGAVALGAIGLATKKVLGNLDKIAKTADGIGITTSSLQELRFAGEQTGLAIGETDKGLEFLVRSMGEATLGTGKLKDVMNKYGLSLTDADGKVKTSDALIKELANTYVKAESSAEKALIATAAFGRSGVRMGNLLKQGSKGIQTYRDEAQALGIVFEDRLLRQAEAANDAMNRLAKVGAAGLSETLGELAPYITKIADELTRMAVAGDLDFSSQAVSGFEGIAKSVGFVIDVVELLRGAYLLLKVGGLNVMLALAEANDAFLIQYASVARIWGQDLTKQIGDSGAGIDALNSMIKETDDAILSLDASFDKSKGIEEFFNKVREGIGAGDIPEKVEDVAAGFDTLNDSLKNEYLYTAQEKKLRVLNEKLISVAMSVDDLSLSEADGAKMTANINAEIDRLTKTTTKAKKPVKEIVTALDRYKKSVKAAQEESEILVDKQAALWQMYKDAEISAETYNEATDALGLSMGELAEETEIAVSAMDAVWGNYVENTQRAFGDFIYNGFKQALDDGENAFAAFGNTLKDMAIKTAAEIAAAFAIKGLTGLLTGQGFAGFSLGGGSSPVSAGAGIGITAAISEGFSSVGAKIFAGRSATGFGGAQFAGAGAGASSAGGYTGLIAGKTGGVVAGGGGGGIGAGLSAAAPFAAGAAVIAIGLYKQAQNEADRLAVTQEAMTAELAGGFQTAETAFLGMSSANVSFTQDLGASGIAAGDVASDITVMSAAMKSVGVHAEQGNDGILKLSGSVAKVKAITEAYNGEAAEGLQRQIRYQAQLNADMGDGVVRTDDMRSALASVTSEFAQSALEAKGLAEEINAIPKEVDITITKTTISQNAEGSGGDSFAVGTGGYRTVPYDGYSPTLHAGEIFNVVPKSQANQSAQLSATPENANNREVVALLAQVVSRLVNVENAVNQSSGINSRGHADTKRQLQLQEA